MACCRYLKQGGKVIRKHLLLISFVALAVYAVGDAAWHLRDTDLGAVITTQAQQIPVNSLLQSEEYEEYKQKTENNTAAKEKTKEQQTIDEIVSMQRILIAQAMKNYTFHPKLNVRDLDSLILERGGRPVRSVVITTWRSGSTFLGDILLSHPGTFYHYEPLLDFGINQVRHGEKAAEAVHNLRHLLNCDYSEMEHYLSYGPRHPWLFSHNKPLWSWCTKHRDLCWKPELLTPLCSLFPFQSVKTVRLRLNLTQELLQDERLGVQVLLLVRDPRGTMQSRHHRDWCPGQPDCDDPARLCSDLVSDYRSAVALRKLFPDSFRVIRYEDLSFDVYNKTRDLLDFFHLTDHVLVRKFLATHTGKNIGGVSSTFRDSRTAPIHWQKDLSWAEVDQIQSVCTAALSLWGYKLAENEQHLRSFMPVGELSFD